jgi:thiamine-phosphate pyrophosphorylase
MYKNNFFLFLSTLNEIITKNIIKFKNISIIYKPDNKINKDFKEVEIIKKFCKKNKIPLYITDNYQLASKYNANGIFISSSNKRFIRPIQIKKNFKIIGSAHNGLEYKLKLHQQCEEIMLSPIFYNKKYSINKILGVNKFNLISINWKVKLCALGGININNLRRLKMSKAASAAFISLIESPKIKKPVYF